MKKHQSQRIIQLDKALTAKRLRCQAKVAMPGYGIAAGKYFHLTRVRQGVYVIKAINVLSREWLEDGSLRCRIYSLFSKREYTVILRRDKQHLCGCAAMGRCYHIDLLVLEENARISAKKEEQRKQEVAPLHGNRPSVFERPQQQAA